MAQRTFSNIERICAREYSLDDNTTTTNCRNNPEQRNEIDQDRKELENWIADVFIQRQRNKDTIKHLSEQLLYISQNYILINKQSMKELKRLFLSHLILWKR